MGTLILIVVILLAAAFLGPSMRRRGARLRERRHGRTD